MINSNTIIIADDAHGLILRRGQSHVSGRHGLKLSEFIALYHVEVKDILSVKVNMMAIWNEFRYATSVINDFTYTDAYYWSSWDKRSTRTWYDKVTYNDGSTSNVSYRTEDILIKANDYTEAESITSTTPPFAQGLNTAVTDTYSNIRTRGDGYQLTVGIRYVDRVTIYNDYTDRDRSTIEMAGLYPYQNLCVWNDESVAKGLWETNGVFTPHINFISCTTYIRLYVPVTSIGDLRFRCNNNTTFIQVRFYDINHNYVRTASADYNGGIIGLERGFNGYILWSMFVPARTVSILNANTTISTGTLLNMNACLENASLATRTNVVNSNVEYTQTLNERSYTALDLNTPVLNGSIPSRIHVKGNVLRWERYREHNLSKAVLSSTIDSRWHQPVGTAACTPGIEVVAPDRIHSGGYGNLPDRNTLWDGRYWDLCCSRPNVRAYHRDDGIQSTGEVISDIAVGTRDAYSRGGVYNSSTVRRCLNPNVAPYTSVADTTTNYRRYRHDGANSSISDPQYRTVETGQDPVNNDTSCGYSPTPVQSYSIRCKNNQPIKYNGMNYMHQSSAEHQSVSFEIVDDQTGRVVSASGTSFSLNQIAVDGHNIVGVKGVEGATTGTGDSQGIYIGFNTREGGWFETYNGKWFSTNMTVASSNLSGLTGKSVGIAVLSVQINDPNP